MTNIADLVRDSAAARPDHPALVTRSTQLTWSEVDQRVDRAARALTQAGLIKGSRVALMIVGMILNQVLIALIILAATTLFTASHRMFHVWRMTGGEAGALSWATNWNFVGQRQFNAKWHSKNTIKLAFGQTHSQEQESRRWMRPQPSSVKKGPARVTTRPSRSASRSMPARSLWSAGRRCRTSSLPRS